MSPKIGGAEQTYHQKYSVPNCYRWQLGEYWGVKNPYWLICKHMRHLWVVMGGQKWKLWTNVIWVPSTLEVFLLQCYSVQVMKLHGGTTLLSRHQCWLWPKFNRYFRPHWAEKSENRFHVGIGERTNWATPILRGHHLSYFQSYRFQPFSYVSYICVCDFIWIYILNFN